MLIRKLNLWGWSGGKARECIIRIMGKKRETNDCWLHCNCTLTQTFCRSKCLKSFHMSLSRSAVSQVENQKIALFSWKGEVFES